MHSTQKTAVAIGLAAMCTVGLAAQTQETRTTTKTRIEINGGKDVTVTGCLERGPNGDYRLTEVRENRRGAPSRYALVTDEDLSLHVGERVEIKGKAVVNGKGTVDEDPLVLLQLTARERARSAWSLVNLSGRGVAELVFDKTAGMPPSWMGSSYESSGSHIVVSVELTHRHES